MRRLSETLTVPGAMIGVVDDLIEGGAQTLTWRGVPCWKNPCDLIIYAEIAHLVRPTLVIETGSHQGGSALFWRDMLRLGDGGLVISVDVKPVALAELGIVFLTGSSTSDEIIDQIHDLATPQDRVLVNLDSDHIEPHVRNELAAYHDLVTIGSYLIVEDGVDDFRWQRPGPYAACNEFLHHHPEFERDRHCERLGITNNPSGYLRRLY